MHLRLSTPGLDPGGRRSVAARPSLGALDKCLPALAGALTIVAMAAQSAEAYRFLQFVDERLVFRSAEAARWNPEDLPLRVRLRDDIPDFLEEADWREIVSRSLRQWTAVGSAEIELILEPGLVPPGMDDDGTDASDGIFTIGWATAENALSAEAAGYATPVESGFRIQSCDIVVVTDTYQAGLDAVENGDSTRERWEQGLENTVLHEVGHCLGLGHTEPHPVPSFILSDGLREIPDSLVSRFGPDTVMSYAAAEPPVLSEDDAVALRLLYPARGYAESKGALSGTLTRDGDLVPFAYVQVVYPGSRPRMGPGAYADIGGYFHIEGLDPGSVLLWVHPVLVQGAPHEMAGAAHESDSLDLLDQWQWARVERGTIVGLPTFELTAGRSP